MNNCGCKRPAFGPEPHAPVPLHGGGFVPNAIEWLKKRIDKLFGTAVFTVNGHEPEGGNVKIVLDDLADKDGNIETTKTIMVSRDGGESHAAVALLSDLTSEIDTHNNDVAAHPELMSTVARVFATKTEVDAKADKSALQAEVDRAQAAEAQLTTKVENAQSAANAAQSAANVAQNTANVANDKADAVYAELANKLDKTAVVAPSASATAGKAADAKAVNDALSGKVDKTEGVVEYSLEVINRDVHTILTGNAIIHGQIGDDATVMLPNKNGTFALTSDIEDAISGKANKSELPYSLVVKEIKNGAVSLDDRADNYVDARTLSPSDSLDIDFPVLVDGRSRDFVLAVECGANPPTISYAAFATIMAEDASTLAPEPGMNIYAFTEFKTNMFLAARKTVDTVVVNTPESSDQVLLAMQKRGIDTTNITDFGEVANTLGLGDTATPQDAIDAVMN